MIRVRRSVTNKGLQLFTGDLQLCPPPPTNQVHQSIASDYRLPLTLFPSNYEACRLDGPAHAVHDIYHGPYEEYTTPPNVEIFCHTPHVQVMHGLSVLRSVGVIMYWV